MSTRTKDETLERLRELLSAERHEERLRRMSPENRALCERITKLRDEIGPIGFNVVEELRKLRESG